MTQRILIDAIHEEEVRVALANDDLIEEYEVETKDKVQVRGNIYVAEVTRVEPSLQAAFINYGANRNGFLAFSEIHPLTFDLPEEEKAEIVQELDDIAERARKRRERYDAQREQRHTQEQDEKDETENSEDIDNAEEINSEKSVTSTDPETKVEAETNTITDVDVKEAATPEKTDDVKPEEAINTPKAEESAKSEDDKTDEEASEKVAIVGGDRRKAAMAAKKTAVSDDVESVSDELPEDLTIGAEAELEAEEDEAEVESGDKKERKEPIHRRYNIQDVIKEGQKILIQVVKEERGNKGAALTTYISLPGRFTVLMPNTPYAGGISRKINDPQERKALKEICDGLDIPKGMGMIVRTAGVGQPKEGIERDMANLLEHWSNITKAMKDTNAPECVYEEGNVILRALRDMYNEEVEEILISGRRAYRIAKDYMKQLMPECASRLKEHRSSAPIFSMYGIERELLQMHHTRVELPSGGYLVLNPTEALISVDVNSGRSTQEKNIEETALKTNLEAADELARQLRLRDLAGLIVVDFIDMEDRRNERAVERALRKAIRRDRARVQVGSISNFGLLEMSRQRLRPSLNESTFIACPHCNGSGMIPSIAASALMVLRALEEENTAAQADQVVITTHPDLAIYLLNHKKDLISKIEERHKLQILIHADEKHEIPDFKLDLVRIMANGNAKTQTSEVILREQAELPPEKRMRKRRRNNKKEKTEKSSTNDAKIKDSAESWDDAPDAEKNDEEKKDKGRNRRKGERRPRRSPRPTEDTKPTEEAQAETNVEATEKEDGKQQRRRSRSRRPEKKEVSAEVKTDTSDTSAEPPDSAEKTEKKQTRRRRSPTSTGRSNARRAPKVEKTDGEKSVTEQKPAEKAEKPAPKPKPAEGVLVEKYSPDGKSEAKEADKDKGGVFRKWWNS